METEISEITVKQEDISEESDSMEKVTGDDVETIENIKKFLDETSLPTNSATKGPTKVEDETDNALSIDEGTIKAYTIQNPSAGNISDSQWNNREETAETIVIVYENNEDEGEELEEEEEEEEEGEAGAFGCKLTIERDKNSNAELITKVKEKYSCLKCNRTFGSLRHLGMHYKWKHYKKNRNPGNKQRVKEEKFRCNRCTLSYDSYTELCDHRKTPGHLADIKCKVCNKKLKFKYLLDLHMKTHVHSDQRLLQIYTCIPCQMDFNTFPKVLLHYEDSHSAELKCILCTKELPYKLGIKRHLRSHRQRLYKCLPCDRVFNSNDELKLHYHSDDHKVSKTCKFCKRSFDTPYKMREHIILVHKKEKPHQCEYCGNIYALIASLNRHKLNEHYQGDIEVMCETCGKVFRSSKTLETHKQTHFKPEIVCYICTKSFDSAQDLEMHLPGHPVHEENMLIPGTCQTCYQDFPNLRDLCEHFLSEHARYLCYKCFDFAPDKRKLHTHLKTHEYSIEFTDDGGVICKICNRKFKYRTSLRYHMYVHTGEKPYQCKVCWKTFRKPYHVKMHLRTHTNERPYECEICSVAFPFKTSLKYHMISHSDKVKCKYCQRVFKSEKACSNHERKIHDSTTGKEIALRPDPLIGDIVPGPKTNKPKIKPEFKCMYCIRVFRTENACQNHMKKYHPQQQNDIEEMDIKECLDPRRKDCLYCHRYFKSQTAFDNHIRRAHPHEPQGNHSNPVSVQDVRSRYESMDVESPNEIDEDDPQIHAAEVDVDVILEDDNGDMVMTTNHGEEVEEIADVYEEDSAEEYVEVYEDENGELVEANEGDYIYIEEGPKPSDEEDQ